MKQPNPHACIPTCLAMLLNQVFPPIWTAEMVMKQFGHDGSELILGKPRRFTMAEVTDLLWQYGYMMPEIVLEPLFVSDSSGSDLPPDTLPCVPLYTREACDKRLNDYLAKSIGMLVGRESFDSLHAVAWFGGKIHDPKIGEAYGYGETPYGFEAYYPLLQIKSK